MTIMSEGGGKQKTGVGPSGWGLPFGLGLALPFRVWGLRSFSGLELALRSEGWPFLFGFGIGASCWVGPSFSWVGVRLSFSWLRVGPSFPVLQLALRVGVGPSFLGSGFSRVWGWPFLILG